MTPPLISLEEHFYSEAVFKSIDARGQALFAAHPQILEKLKDVETWRLPSMDANGVAMQVMSHAWQTGGGTAQACRTGNDELASRIKFRKSRFAAFSALPIAEPEQSAVELERTVRAYGFVGALIDSHVNGRYLDGGEYDRLWHTAQELDVPIYIHPAFASEKMIQERYAGPYSVETAMSLGLVSWGWHEATGLQILRLFAAGVFDRFPRLKIIIGHFGEMLPFMLERIDGWAKLQWDKRDRSLMTVWNENIWVTTSGVWSLNPMKCLLGNTKLDRILYSVDYPFTSNEQGLAWFRELEQSGLVDEEGLQMIAHKNAEKLLKLRQL